MSACDAAVTKVSTAPAESDIIVFSLPDLILEVRTFAHARIRTCTSHSRGRTCTRVKDLLIVGDSKANYKYLDPNPLYSSHTMNSNTNPNTTPNVSTTPKVSATVAQKRKVRFTTARMNTSGWYVARRLDFDEEPEIATELDHDPQQFYWNDEHVALNESKKQKIDIHSLKQSIAKFVTHHKDKQGNEFDNVTVYTADLKTKIGEYIVIRD